MYRSWRRLADSYAGDRMFVGEVWVQSPARLARYLRPDELHTAFTFGFLLAPWDAAALRKAVVDSIEALAEVGAPPTWVLSNHDVTRHVTRFGGGEVGLRRARSAALLMLALPGGAYVYQGEELGLPEVTDLPDELREDPTFIRTAVPRSGATDAASRSPGGDPHLRSEPDHPTPRGSRSRRTGRSSPSSTRSPTSTSTLSLYREALRLRRRRRAEGDERLEWLESEPERDRLPSPGERAHLRGQRLGRRGGAARSLRRGRRVLLASNRLPADPHPRRHGGLVRGSGASDR